MMFFQFWYCLKEDLHYQSFGTSKNCVLVTEVFSFNRREKSFC